MSSDFKSWEKIEAKEFNRVSQALSRLEAIMINPFFLKRVVLNNYKRLDSGFPFQGRGTVAGMTPPSENFMDTHELKAKK